MKKFKIEYVNENGTGHYKVTNLDTGEVIHCDLGELNETLYELGGIK